MVGLSLRNKTPAKAPAKASTVFDRMAKLAAGGTAQPGGMLTDKDGCIEIVPRRTSKADMQARAAKALANKPAPKPTKLSSKRSSGSTVKLPKKQPAKVYEAPAVVRGAVTRKVGGAAAPTSVAARITAWSYSRYNKWFACPLSAKFNIIDKLKEPGSPAMQRGIEIHGLAEQYAKGQLKNLPLELQKFKAEFLDLVKRKPECEGEWAFRADWSETTWFGKDAWCRVKTDATYYDAKTRTVVVIDHKTGKPREEHAGQLSLYAVAAFIRYPQALKVSARLWYLDHGEETSQEFLRSELLTIQNEWASKVAPMLADTRFVARPGEACRFCHFKKANGGPCKW